MAGIAPFDMLREGGNVLPDLDKELLDRLQSKGGSDPTLELQNPGIDPANMTAQEASNFISAGMVENGQGRIVDPMRDIALSRDSQYELMQEHDKAKREKIADSMLFKVGDTLADAGRTFLSPLFWLKGEDQSQYDPSDRLKTGYRTQFYGLQELRTANVEKFLNARNQRLNLARDYEIKQTDQRITSMSSEAKRLMNFAYTSPQRLNLYNDKDPETQQASMDQLIQQEALSRGDGMVVTDSLSQRYYLSNNQISAVDTYSKAFVDQTQTLRDGFANIQQLLGTPEEDGTGITDVAAIFSFLRGIDPGSVVRESEVQLFRETLGLMERFELNIKNKKEGRVLSAAQISQLKKYARTLGGMMSRKFNDRESIARQQLSSLGLDSAELQTNYLGGYTAPNFDEKAQDSSSNGGVNITVNPTNPNLYDEFVDQEEL